MVMNLSMRKLSHQSPKVGGILSKERGISRSREVTNGVKASLITHYLTFIILITHFYL